MAIEAFSGSIVDETEREPVFESSGGRVPPHSLDAEQSLLGAVLLDNETIHSVLEVLTAEDFYHESHKALFRAMMVLYDRGSPIDITTLGNQLRAVSEYDIAGGSAYLSKIVDAVPTAANTMYYARIIKEMSLRRRLIHEASEIVTEAFTEQGDIDSFIDSVEQRIMKVSESRTNAGFSRVFDVLKDSVKQIDELYRAKGPIGGVPSGFADLDLLTSGLQPSDLIIIAGRPAMGKTSLALSIGRHVAVEQGKGIAVFSLEMSKQQVVMRMICSEARVSNAKVRSGKFSEQDYQQLIDAASNLAKAPVFIDDTGAISVLEMRAKARRLHRETPLSLIVVDYLQLMRGVSKRFERREQEISEISGALKSLAKELNIPVIALSQLNRGVETRQDKRPMLADLRESGAIEQDADIIGFVYRDEVYNQDSAEKGIAELIISKHRNGDVGTIKLAFQAEFTNFANLAPESYESSDYDYLGSELFEEDEELP